MRILVQEVSNWGLWGNDDELGAANLITPAKRKQALGFSPGSLAKCIERWRCHAGHPVRCDAPAREGKGSRVAGASVTLWSGENGLFA